MFNKAKDSKRKEAEPASNLIGASKHMTRNTTPSILSADLTVVGSIKTQGEIQLDGSVEGDIRAKALTIGEKAVIKGEIHAEVIIVRGKVIGKLRARQIQLSSTAHVEGDIIHATLSMENGAFFEGQCHHDSDPMSTRKNAPQAAPAVANPNVGKTSTPAEIVRADTAMAAKKQQT